MITNKKIIKETNLKTSRNCNIIYILKFNLVYTESSYSNIVLEAGIIVIAIIVIAIDIIS